MLIDLHRRYGIRTFKIDGVDIPDKTADVRFRAMLDKVMEATGGEAVFNLDATAGQRFGYHYLTQYGNIFLENRYTDWSNYYPHWTLRNLWTLSRYVPPQSLQIEFLNRWRNADKYPADDPLAPVPRAVRVLLCDRDDGPAAGVVRGVGPAGGGVRSGAADQDVPASTRSGSTPGRSCRSARSRTARAGRGSSRSARTAATCWSSGSTTSGSRADDGAVGPGGPADRVQGGAGAGGGLRGGCGCNRAGEVPSAGRHTFALYEYRVVAG